MGTRGGAGAPGDGEALVDSVGPSSSSIDAGSLLGEGAVAVAGAGVVGGRGVGGAIVAVGFGSVTTVEIVGSEGAAGVGGGSSGRDAR